jgi:hypothetical protein
MRNPSREGSHVNRTLAPTILTHPSKDKYYWLICVRAWRSPADQQRVIEHRARLRAAVGGAR